MSESQVVWSLNGEFYNYDSLHDLLDMGVVVGQEVYFGEVLPVSSYDVTGEWMAETVIDQISNNAWDMVGEIAEDFPNVSKDAMEELSTFIHDWLERHDPPRFYQVKRVQSYFITQDDIDSAQQ